MRAVLFFVLVIANFFLENCSFEDRGCYREVRNTNGSIRKESVDCSYQGARRYRRRGYYGK